MSIGGKNRTYESESPHRLLHVLPSHGLVLRLNQVINGKSIGCVGKSSLRILKHSAVGYTLVFPSGHQIPKL